ncbi:MAG: hypothetical protein KBS85_02750 [Lachnospiraceae bacterium]|nr:hypothetical protein [Candidatus Merdinaster equi]
MSEQSNQNTDDLLNNKNGINDDSDNPGEDDEKKSLKTKMIPAVVMLLGGAVSSVVCYVNKYSLKDMSIVILCSLVCFLFLGFLLKRLFDSFKLVDKVKDSEENKQNQKEGEVIRKDNPSSNES